MASSTLHVSVHDWEETQPSVAVVNAVAALEDAPPSELRPLGECIDAHALDQFVGGPDVSASFRFAGYRVRIDTDELRLCSSEET